MHENKIFRSSEDFWLMFFAIALLPLSFLSIFFMVLGSNNSTEMRNVGLLMSALAVLVSIVFIVFLVKRIRYSALCRRLEKSGTMVMGVVTEIRVVKHVYINGYSPTLVVCSADINGTTYQFSSNWLSPNVDDSFIGMPVPIYFDSGNIGNYYVNCKEAMRPRLPYMSQPPYNE